MIEQRRIEKQFFKNMLFNLLTFICIFAIFGIVIFNQVKISLYNGVDDKLNASKLMAQRGDLKELNITNIDTTETSKVVTTELPNENINPRVIYILRDKEGNVKNQDSIGRFFEDFINYVEFNKTSLNNIYNTKVNGYVYRTINFTLTDKDGNLIYVQMLMNIDSEQDIITNFFNILSISILFTVISSFIASYVLSRKTLKPVIDAWNKQMDFVQNSSHELRTPLTIIQARQELLLLDKDSKIADKEQDIKSMLNEVKRLSKLTNDLMTLAKSDADINKLSKQEVEMNGFLKEIVNPYEKYVQDQKKNIELNLNYGKNISIDKNKIHELIVILLDNAIKYTEEEDKIEINMYEKNNRCVIEVKDTGIGISKEAMKHIFERFYREDKSRTRKTGGSGLGLAIASEIVKLHNGTIEVSNNNPKGSIFTIKLK